MRNQCIMAAITVLGLILALPGPGVAGSSRCVILEKEGTRALVSCNGKPARYIDLGGRAEMYKAGDTVDKRTFPGVRDRKMKQK